MVQVGRILIACLLAGLTACRLPPYNPEVSLAMLTAGRLDRRGSVGPFSGDIDERVRYTFVPDRDFLAAGAPLSGWVVGVGQTYMGARYCWGGSSISYRQWGDFLAASGAGLRLLTVSVAAPPRLLVMRFQGPEAWLQQLYDDGVSLQVQTAARMNALGVASDFRRYVELADADFPDMAPGIMGAGPVPVPYGASSQVRLAFLSRDALGGVYREGAVTWDAGVPDIVATEQQPAFVSGLPDPVDVSCFYQFCAQTGYAYLSIPREGGGTSVYRWDHSSHAAELLGLDRRVEAALSTGRLFCRSSDTAYIHSPSGEQIAKFPMGALEFVGEYWDWVEGRFRMVFVLPLLGGEDDEGPRTLSFEVYTWPTEDVTSLD